MRCKKKRDNHQTLQKTMRRIGHRFEALGSQFVYSILLLFYAYKRSDTPVWARNIILGALAYFVSPIDSIPDLTPFLGFTDDMGVLTFGLVSIACYINEDVRQAAKEQLTLFFKNVDPEDLEAVDAKL